MKLPGALDAAVRYAVLTAVGLLLLFWIPAEAFGAEPVWILAGRPGPTSANLIGITVILAAWVYFMIVFSIRAAGGADPVCWASLIVAVASIAGFGVASLAGNPWLAMSLLVVAAVAQCALPVRLLRHPATGRVQQCGPRCHDGRHGRRA